MYKRMLKRSIALITVFLMMFVYMLPVYAAEDRTRYRISEVRFLVPEEAGYTGKLTGPDVQEDGSVFMELGKKYNFTWEGTAPRDGNEYGFDISFAFRDFSPAIDTFSALSINGADLFAEYPESGYDVKIEFIDVYLQELRKQNQDSMNIFLDGMIKIEVRCMVEEIFEIALPDLETDIEAYYEALRHEHISRKLSESKELVYYMEFDGTNLSTSYSEEMREENKALEMHCFYNIYQDGHASNDIYSCVAEYQGERYEFLKKSEIVPHVFLRPYIGLKICPLEWEWEAYELKNEAREKAVATAATAGAIGLGGSALANVVTGFSDDELPPVQKKHIYGEDEDAELEEGMEKMPELPEKDTPDVSMSIYKPFKALVNTKGAAADLHITIKGGEGLRWNYIPTAVCLDGLKAVIPTVAGHGAEATLVLALTGATLKKSHTSVFVTVVAWAYTEAGQLVKTTGSAEISLHSKGLEAKWNKDGTLNVCSYSDGNLDGIAEIKELSEDEYIVSEEENGEITIRAKEKRLGSVTIAGKQESERENGGNTNE